MASRSDGGGNTESGVAKAGELPLKDSIRVAVRPRQPRLAWQGMDRKEAVTSVPTQVVEIVRAGRAVERASELVGLSARPAEAHREIEPENRLIWTNDNLVALRTLLEEKDVGGAFRYRGKVDLVYIDPPFMVNNDFMADNSIDVSLDEEEHLQAKKEPSLVELLAYKDTWRQGLDSFLSMLRKRLVLLAELLARSGSIYVHLDWHAAHYVKVLMDEILGYESFLNEIVWQRQTSHSDTGQGAKHLGRIHDTLLVYTRGPDPFVSPGYTPYDGSYVRSHYKYKDERGRRFRYDNLTAPGGAAKGNPYYELMGHKKFWRYSEERMAKLVAEGRVVQPSPGAVPAYKRYLDEMPGVPFQDVWTDISSINSQAVEALGYPTQKPVELLERIIATACPQGGLVLDCFVGSGTTAEAAERLGRRWIGIDNGKYGIHLARKRLIQLHDERKPAEKIEREYVECQNCGNIERKDKASKTRDRFRVRPFTVENMGVYQRAAEWQDFQTHRSRYRDEMIKVFGGNPESVSPLLHGKKENAWVHIGPLDGPVSSAQVWAIAREAQRTDTKAVTILSADFDTLSASEKDEIRSKTKVTVTIRIIPASAIDEVRRRLEIQRYGEDKAIESMAVPAFYAPLSILLSAHTKGRAVRVVLERCEVDIESFLASQRPLLKPLTGKLSDVQAKKVKAEHEKWEEREAALKAWLKKAKSWQSFVDYWAIDWNYGSRVGADGKAIFETDWQSFRTQRGKERADRLTFSAEFKYADPGKYRLAARVTDVFGNDGIATIDVEVT
jgi:DNA modification methylase